MNAYFENTGYRTNTRTQNAASSRRFGDGIISLICAIIGMLSCTVAVRIEKVAFSMALFIAFFGIVGGIESGAISMFFGLVICALISLFQYMTLKSLCKRAGK